MHTEAITKSNYEAQVFTPDYKSFSEGIYSVPEDKTEGEARSKLKSVDSGDGLEAYRRIHVWFAMTTGLGLAERRIRVMMPLKAER